MQPFPDEPPEIEFNCAVETCELRNLSFIPAKCDGCGEIFCRHHIKYATHNCSKPGEQQVLICPLCNMTVKDEPYSFPTDNVFVKVHMDQMCTSDIAVARRMWAIQHIRSCAY